MKIKSQFKGLKLKFRRIDKKWKIFIQRQRFESKETSVNKQSINC